MTRAPAQFAQAKLVPCRLEWYAKAARSVVVVAITTVLAGLFFQPEPWLVVPTAAGVFATWMIWDKARRPAVDIPQRPPLLSDVAIESPLVTAARTLSTLPLAVGILMGCLALAQVLVQDTSAILGLLAGSLLALAGARARRARGLAGREREGGYVLIRTLSDPRGDDDRYYSVQSPGRRAASHAEP